MKRLIILFSVVGSAFGADVTCHSEKSSKKVVLGETKTYAKIYDDNNSSEILFCNGQWAKDEISCYNDNYENQTTFKVNQDAFATLRYTDGDIYTESTYICEQKPSEITIDQIGMEEIVGYYNRLGDVSWNGGPRLYVDQKVEDVSFEFIKEKAFDLKKELYNYGGCVDSKFIVSRYNSVASAKLEDALNHFFSNYDRLLEDDLNDSNSEYVIIGYKDDVKNLVISDDNALVIYSGYQEGSWDEPESCLMFKFRIYKKDGTVVSLNFDVTD